MASASSVGISGSSAGAGGKRSLAPASSRASCGRVMRLGVTAKSAASRRARPRAAVSGPSISARQMARVAVSAPKGSMAVIVPLRMRHSSAVSSQTGVSRSNLPAKRAMGRSGPGRAWPSSPSSPAGWTEAAMVVDGVPGRRGQPSPSRSTRHVPAD